MNKEQAVMAIGNHWKGPIAVDLREGEQFAGQFVGNETEGRFQSFEFSLPEAQSILQWTHSIGIPYAEVPNALVNGMDTFIASLAQMPHRPKLLSHIRNNLQDLNAVIAIGSRGQGIEGVNILMSVDPERIKAFGFDTLNQYLLLLQQVVMTAQENNLETRVSVEHSWNGYFNDALKVFEMADKLGVDRIGMADTVGIASRFDVEERVKDTREIVKHADIEVHFHNDGFAAVSNAIEALIHGANYVDTTLAGLGERSGITPLSGLIAQLYMMAPHLVEHMGLEYVTPAEQAMMAMTGLPVPHNLTTSPNGFAAKAGIHVKEMSRHSLGARVYEPFDPGVIGNTRRIITGTRISGRSEAMNIRVLIPNAMVQ